MPPPSSAPDDAPEAAASPAGGRWRAASFALAVFAVHLVALLAFFDPRAGADRPLLYDTDAEYHLAVARAWAEPGPLRELAPLRRSVLGPPGGPGFGDKELLFHLLLEPAATSADPVRGGRVALAALLAVLAATVATVARPALGGWASLLPAALAITSPELSWRLVRLRPELLSLELLLVGIALAAAGRQRLLGATAALYTLSYTAWHAFLGLFGLLFAWRWIARRRCEPALVLWPLLGVAVGLWIHPGYPANLRVWVVQNVTHYTLGEAVDLGSENLTDRTQVAVMANLAWLLAMAATVASARRRAAAVDDTLATRRRVAARDRAEAWALAALVFLALYAVVASRFVLYAVPFATLAVLHGLDAAGLRAGPRLRVGGGRTLPSAIAVPAVAIVAVVLGAPELARFRARTSPGPQAIRRVEREALGRAVPVRAKISAPWSQTGTYLLWAPQGRYLNTLDPTFMAAVDPAGYAVQRRVFAGEEPDVPLALRAGIDSDWLMFSRALAAPALAARLAGDPRLVRRLAGIHELWQVVPAPGAFVLDWQVAGADEDPPRWRRYPRLADPGLAALEGWVDARRAVEKGCARFATELPGEAPVELAPSGPTELWLDGRPLATVAGSQHAVLGAGVRLMLPGSAPTRQVMIVTCPDESGRTGFYLRRL